MSQRPALSLADCFQFQPRPGLLFGSIGTRMSGFVYRGTCFRCFFYEFSIPTVQEFLNLCILGYIRP